MRALVIEDDEQVAEFVVKGLKENGFAVDSAGDGREGLFLAASEPYDVIVLDRMLPFVDGLSLLKTLRTTGSDVPVLILSAMGEVNQRETQLQVGSLSLDLLSRKVFRKGQEIELKPREFQLLEFLMRHAGQIMTRTMILEHVWDYNFDPQTNVIDVHISRLRGKIDKEFDYPLLETVRGAGYRLHAPD